MGSCSSVWQSAIGLGDLVVKVPQKLLYELYSLNGGCHVVGFIGEYCRVIQGDIRSSDYSSYM